MVVCVDNLTVRYPSRERPALEGFSTKIASQEIVFLAGPTGCGKSTLLGALSGVIPHVTRAEVTGAIRICGRDPRTSSLETTCSHVAHLFQNVESQLFTDRVEDEVLLPLEFGALQDADPMETCARSLATFGLQDKRQSSVAELSSGYKQRLVLASLHLGSKALLLLDEPFSYLDAKSAESLQQTLLSLKQAGLAIVVADHREDLVRQIADREIRFERARTTSFALKNRHEPGEVVLDVDDLSFSYKDRPVIKDITFQLRQRECLVVQGDNGSGKTTLCHLLAGLLRPERGKISVSGKSPHKVRGKKRSELLKLILQNPDRQLFGSTVEGELDIEEPTEILKRLGLWDLRRFHPKSLSFGQKRRLTLAKALARTPRLLILDEPSIGQDNEHLSSLLDELDRFLTGGGALVLTTHDPRVLQAMRAHRCMICRDSSVS